MNGMGINSSARRALGPGSFKDAIDGIIIVIIIGIKGEGSRHQWTDPWPSITAQAEMSSRICVAVDAAYTTRGC
ncbi:hypothetical protein ACLKA6_013936 [Drosophila palustris]